MPPKKDDVNGAGEAIPGFTAKETRMIAAAFVSSTGPDKYDYDLFATLTGNTVGSLRKMWPPVKRKVADAHGSFATFLNSTAAPAAAKPKANGAQKRKASSIEPADEEGIKKSGPEAEANGNGNDNDGTTEKKTPTKGRKKKSDSVVADGEGEKEKKPAAKRGRKKVKTEEAEEAADKEMTEAADDDVTQEDV